MEFRDEPLQLVTQVGVDESAGRVELAIGVRDQHFGLENLGADRGQHLVGIGLSPSGTTTAWVHGDATAVRFGATPVGLPTGAGYAVGNRLVDAYLAATGLTAAGALLADAAEVILVATT